MIELTVKTLDSQNHSFTVNDDITVAEFKQKIADSINIPPETQRIIYCGRILKDDIKLSEYDVNGKVVHLVQRAPPSNSQNTNRNASPQPQRRNVRGLEHGMYLGSMAFPSNLMETQGIVPPPPTHSLAASRLNVAKRMLRRAECVLSQLENPTSRNSDQASSEEPQEEVTPVFEARVIVPGSSLNEPIDEVISAVQNRLLNATAPAPPNGAQAGVMSESNGEVVEDGANAAASNNVDMETPPLRSASSTPEGASPVFASVENLAGERGGNNNAGGAAAAAEGPVTDGPNGPTLADNASSTSEMADLLDTLGRLQIRLAPFLEQYQNFMRQDPSLSNDDVRKTQGMINRVSEILHFLGHAYHSLSDIIVRARTPPPRPLLCRPILIQHSAVVQTGFPIQVEAEINISPDSMPPNTTQQSTTNTTNTSTTTPASNTTTNAGPTFTAHIPPQMLGLLPTSVHVQSFPIEIRGIHRANVGGATPRDVPMAGSEPTPNGGAPTEATPVPPPATGNSDANTNAGGPTATATTSSGGSTSGTSQFNNPNVEFFMEVTPESITIDSLEATLLGANQGGDVLRGAMNAPPPEFLQSIMQMAGQIINRTTNPQGAPTSTASAPTTTANADSAAQASSQSSAQSAGAGQNSQARGNTQTHPTTSTHTRSTARPHVHLSQHAMQGFDPFLPCNSHHVTPRRRFQARSLQAQSNQNNNARQDAAMPPQGVQLHPIYNIVQGIVNSFRNAYRQRSTQQPNQAAAATAAPPSGGVGNMNADLPITPPSEPVPSPPLLMQMPFLPHLQNMNISDITGPHGPTLSQLMEQFSDDNLNEGDSIFTDLIMLLSRNLTIADLIRLNNGQLEPLMRIRSNIRTFFLERVLDGNTSSASVDRGVNRFMGEMLPLLENLESLVVRDNIDIIRSSQLLFRTRLPNIISLAASRNPNSLRMLVDQCSITMRQLCALVLYASANGQQGVEDVLDHIVRQYMQGVPRVFEAWTSMASRAQLRHFILNLNIPHSILQPYIVRRIETVTPPLIHVNQDRPAEEPMEVEEQVEASGSSNGLPDSVINLQSDPEPLPPVDLGSESWHDQVPAEWVPIIVRDTRRQRRQFSQPAFSDAYLSGMPSKRRKIVTNAKPQGSLPQVIQESVRRAVTTTGLATVAPLETVSQAAAADISIQSAYRDLLRSSVQSTLQDNEDFTPERYPNASNYFNKP
ncbi:large proline-rich protein bag6 [Holotrichia oblita]|uniref:Large proline-rich protein bag6 n=1 Tax=Holotrichia oblita TaxID=644536 RepID=A0ACB9TY43_HOLOL|nr:large proline-rich protein bag6 [Holotrichia oblita]